MRGLVHAQCLQNTAIVQILQVPRMPRVRQPVAPQMGNSEPRWSTRVMRFIRRGHLQRDGQPERDHRKGPAGSVCAMAV